VKEWGWLPAGWLGDTVQRWTTPGGCVAERCPGCGYVGVWSSTQPDAVYAPPPGHRITREAGMMLDECPGPP
jgi:hypothetical protein